MLDNYGLRVEKLVSRESGNVNSPTIAPTIKDDFERESFKRSFNEAKTKKIKKNFNVEAVKEDISEDILVDESLNTRVSEQKIISQLVKEKFVNNPIINTKINLTDGLDLEERLHEIVNFEEDKITVSEKVIKSASETFIEELQRVVNSINEEK